MRIGEVACGITESRIKLGDITEGELERVNSALSELDPRPNGERRRILPAAS
jgi:hypothetical protein